MTVLLLLWFFQTQSEFPTERYNTAIKHLDNGEFETGIEQLQNIGLETGSKRVLCWIAWGHLRARNLDAAEKAAKNLIYSNTQPFYKAYGEQILGAVANRRGNFLEAEGLLNQALERLQSERFRGSSEYQGLVKNNIFATLVELALTKAFLGNGEEARHTLNRAQALTVYAGKNLGRYYSVCCIIALSQGNFDGALYYAEEVLRGSLTPKQQFEAKIQLALVKGLLNDKAEMKRIVAELKPRSPMDKAWVRLIDFYGMKCKVGKMPRGELEPFFKDDPSLLTYFNFLKEQPCPE